MVDANKESLIVRSMTKKIIANNAEKDILSSLENAYIMSFSGVRKKQMTIHVKSVGSPSINKGLFVI